MHKHYSYVYIIGVNHKGQFVQQSERWHLSDEWCIWRIAAINKNAFAIVDT